MSEHTKGPWVCSSEDFVRDLHGKPIACVYGDDREDLFAGPVTQANARLIAAAPDLLRELSSLVQLCEVWIERGALNRSRECLESARAILARAKGEA